MNRLPTGRSYQGVAALVPGVSGGANPNIKGGFFRSNRYLFDGLDVTDPGDQHLRHEHPLRVDAGGGGPDRRHGRRNTTPWAGSSTSAPRAARTSSTPPPRATATTTSCRAPANFGSQLYEVHLPFNPDEVGPTQSYQTSLNVGGPILQAQALVPGHLRSAPGRDLAGQAGPAGRRALQHPAPSADERQPPGRPAPLLRPGHPAPDLAVRPTCRRASSTTPPAATAGWAWPRTTRTRTRCFGVLGWDWFLSGNVSTQLQAGFVYEHAGDRPPGLAGQDRLRRLRAGSSRPSGVHLRPQPAPARQPQRQQHLVPGRRLPARTSATRSSSIPRSPSGAPPPASTR